MTTVTRTTQILVRASLGSAFDYVSDLSRHPEWNGGLKIEAVTPGPVAVGKEYISRGVVVTQKNRPNTVRVSLYDPPHKYGFIAKDPDFGNVSHEFTFTPKNNDVLITRTMTLTLNPIVAFSFRLFIYPLIGRPSMIRSLSALKMKLDENAKADVR